MKTKLKNFILAIIDFRCFLNFKKKFRLKYNNRNSGKVYILTSGPSLNQTFEALTEDFFIKKDCCFVNDMAQLSCYEKIKPSFYAMADPCYWVDADKTNETDVIARNKTLDALVTKTKWDLKLFVHKNALNSTEFVSSFSKSSYIKIIPITIYDLNTKSEIFQNFTYKYNFAAPSANVLCMAIFCCLNLGYKNVFIFGADHSWMPDVRINDKNQVCTIKRHVGEDDSPLIPWTKSNKSIFTLPEILISLYYTFDNYHRLEAYAKYLSTKIYNVTPNSFIDAFERLSTTKLKYNKNV